MVFYCELQLFGDIRLTARTSGAPDKTHSDRGKATLTVGCGKPAAGRRPPLESAGSLQPAVHWLPGPVRVLAGERHALLAMHNTVGMRFEVGAPPAQASWRIKRGERAATC